MSIIFNGAFINRYITGFLMSVSSGVVYGLLVLTVTALLNDHAVSLEVIGLLSLRMLPYSFKYVWAYLVDSCRIKVFPENFGARKEWMISMQVLLIICMVFVAFFDVSNIKSLFVLTLLISLFGATYDICLEAYKMELFSREKLIIGNPVVIWGFRVGFLFAGGFCLYLASFISWRLVFLVMIIPILVCMVTLFFSRDDKRVRGDHCISSFGGWFRTNVYNAFSTVSQIPRLHYIIPVVSFYKLSDGFIDVMLIPFLTEIGFSKPEIAGFSQVSSVIGVAFGTVAGAYLLKIAKLWKVLLVAEVMAAVTNLLFIILVNSVKNDFLMASVSIAESFCSSICNVTLIHYMCFLCRDSRFFATHYSILIALSGMSRAIFCSFSGVIASNVGWTYFFVFSSMLSVPSILCIILLNEELEHE
ncbi:MFS transporter [Candidatus Lariskella endosymbiont of Hedychridium roseum]|uniref:MFS transporter n=1 Tax=Candidatus Lariskella endosymbiont of Hedychridium roseum TaxID=3077949 RepID=UPI0030CF3E40